MSDIEVREVKQKMFENGDRYYQVLYPHPDTGIDHVHIVPLQAVATRAELLGLSYEQAVELIVSEAHMPNDDVDAMYRTALERKHAAVKRTAQEKRAQRVPFRQRLDAEVAAFRDTDVDAERIHRVRTGRRVLGGSGWNELVSRLRADHEEVDRHGAYYLYGYMVNVESVE